MPIAPHITLGPDAPEWAPSAINDSARALMSAILRKRGRS